jgi:hypothetical protein
MQGKAQNIGVFLSGTPQFIYDERRGLFNYDALRTRLEDNRFSSQNFVDFTTPVIKLKQLSPEEIFILLERLCELHSSHYDYDCTLGKDQLTAFLNTVLSRLGADQLLTPREITRDFLGLLNILQQNSNITFATLMDEQNYSVKSADEDPETISSDNDDLFAEFDI